MVVTGRIVDEIIEMTPTLPLETLALVSGASFS
jgi:hypothetical protein